MFGTATALAFALSAAVTAQEPPAEALLGVRTALAQATAAESLRAARELLELYPDSTEAALLVGHALRLSGDPGGAARAYLAVLARRPERVEAQVGLAELHRQAGDLDGALDSYGRALQLDPADFAAHRGAGEVYVQLSRHAEAAAHLLACLELDPGSGDLRYLAGVSLYLAGDLDGAIGVLEEGLRREPDAVPLEYALGVVLADRPADHARALGLLQDAEAGGWEVADAAYLQGRILSDRGDHIGAVAALRRAVAASPDKLDANYRLAQSLARTGDRQGASAAMSRFNELQRAFNDSEYRIKRLGALDNELAAAIGGGDRASVERLVRELLDAAPEDPRNLVRCAKVWISLGDLPSAHDAITAATQLAPEDWEARYLEGLLLLALERPEEALWPLEASRREHPLFADTYNLTGNALMMLNRPGPASEAYLAAAELEPDNAGYWLNLANAYRDAGRPDLEAAARRQAQRRR